MYTITEPQYSVTFIQNSIKTIKQHSNSVVPPGRNSWPLGDSTQNKNSCSSLMSRLAVGLEPPGGFWEKPRKHNQTVQNQMECMQFSINYNTVHRTCIKASKTTPLTWNSLLNHEFWCISNPKNFLDLLLHVHNVFQPLHPLTISSSFLKT